jgi:hypothetical protein
MLFMANALVHPVAPVVVVGFDMPFWPLVRFLVKVAIASIPAGLVIALFYMLLGLLYGGIMVALHRVPH